METKPTVTFSIKLPLHLAEFATAQAKADGRSRNSWLVRLLAREYINEIKDKAHAEYQSEQWAEARK